MSFHGARHCSVGLIARRLNHLCGQEAPEEQGDDQDHHRSADELSEGELPAEQ